MTTKEDANDINKIKADLDALREDLAALSSSMSAAAANQGREASERLHDTVAEGRERAQKMADDAGRHIEDNPWASVAIAFGLGVLIGKILDR